MRIADVIGTVTLNRWHPSVAGATWKLVVPLSWDNLLGRSDEPAEEVVAFDELGAGLGSRIAISEGREAAMPFHPQVKPIDAYNAAILDTLQLGDGPDLREHAPHDRENGTVPLTSKG
jgi:microcompartment protein CcmK/EutM